MKFILLVTVFICVLANATPYSYNADFTSAPQVMAATYNNQPQLELTTVSGPMTIVQLVNSSSVPIEANCNSITKPSPAEKGSFQILSNSTVETPWNLMYQSPIGYKCWFRSVSALPSSGAFQAIGWGK